MKPKIPNNTVIKFDGFRKLTLKERLMILFGFNLQAVCAVHIHRRDSSVKARANIVLTKVQTPLDQRRETRCIG